MAEHAGSPVQVLLLARDGEARQKLEQAIADAGAELLRSVDPAEADPGGIIALRPGAVLVALEPAIEDALEHYDALLSDPGVLVMFDEAELAARRDGWDAARWVRHLAAKLNGHGNVLPEGTERDDEAAIPDPGALPASDFDPGSVDPVAMDEAAQAFAVDVPQAEPFAAPQNESEPEPEPEPEPSAGSDVAAGIESGDSHSGLVVAEDMDWSSSAAADDGALADDPALAELLASSAAAQARMQAAAPPAPGLEEALAAHLPDADDASTAGDAGEPDGGMGDAADEVDAAPAQAVDPLSLGSSLSLAEDDAPLAARGNEGGIDLEALESRLAGLSLAEDDGPIVPRVPSAGVDLDDLESRLGGLSLADPDSYGHGVLRGAVLVEAGLGGPDAVRQLLGGLGEDFARPVLVRLQLDGGRYERLVQQMQRASVLPVALAEADAEAEGGKVYFLPPEITLAEARSKLLFAAGTDGVGGYEALPAGDSALVFLSGASAERVEAAMAMAGAGALVLAQAPDSCYDAAAVNALIARGAVAAQPGDLAQALADRWP